jgi:hypothetical protein
MISYANSRLQPPEFLTIAADKLLSLSDLRIKVNMQRGRYVLISEIWNLLWDGENLSNVQPVSCLPVGLLHLNSSRSKGRQIFGTDFKRIWEFSTEDLCCFPNYTLTLIHVILS